MGVESPYSYIGSDAFDDGYAGFVPFSNGSWISGKVAYDATKDANLTLPGRKTTVDPEMIAKIDDQVHKFIEINNLILETDYYQ